VTYPAYGKYTRARQLGGEGMPTGWQVRRLKFAATCNDEALPETTAPDLEIAYVDISGVDLVGGITVAEAQTFEQAPSRARRVVRDGDTIISTVRTYLKAIARIESPPQNMIVSTGFAVIRPLEYLDSGFLGYALQSTAFIDAVAANSTGVSYPAINPTALMCLSIGYPSNMEEQRQIAAFLDWKTKQIDALIAKKNELTDKLRENRASVITHAVTKGVNPATPVRDSAIRWLGSVPQHWEVKRLKWSVMLQRGHDLPADDRADGNVPVVTSSGVSALHDRAIAKAPGIVTGRYGTIGVFHLIECDYWPLNTTLYSIDLYGNCPRFLRALLENLSPLFLLNAVKSAVPSVDRNDLLSIPVAIPDLAEQTAIADYLDEETRKIDRMCEAVESAIARLVEYRAALITATTTGKIDVRQVAIPAQA
jgi:type I restriction enzyme, S subunit